MSFGRQNQTRFVRLLFAALCLTAVPAHAAPHLMVIFSFGGTSGETQDGGLLADSAGNLYGATSQGGASGNGTVFKLTPPAPGKTMWTETVIFASFNTKTGEGPEGGLLADSAGNLYGVTSTSGKYNGGTAFKLAPPVAGRSKWTLTVLSSFGLYASPSGGLIADSAGNLYGTLELGGKTGLGAVFQLAPPATGKKAWAITTLASFYGKNGAYPLGGLIADASGNLYGTTSDGGSVNGGIVFRLAPPVAGKKAWAETLLTQFRGQNGASPYAGVIADGAGNLYGTTTGASGLGLKAYNGNVFKLSPPTVGETAWSEAKLASFAIQNGITPEGRLLGDSAGNLYAAIYGGGTEGDAPGKIIKLTPPATGQAKWTESILVAFNGENGAYPRGSLTIGSDGNIYGTTLVGGDHNKGTVFELMP